MEGKSEADYFQPSDYFAERGAVKVIPKRSPGKTAENFSFTTAKVARTCAGVKVDGSACRARPLANGMLCWFHTRQAEKVDSDA